MKKIIIILVSFIFIMNTAVVVAKTKNNTVKNNVTKNEITKTKQKPEKKYPTGCRVTGFNYSQGVLVLVPDEKNIKQAIYFVHNNSKQDVTFFDQRDSKAPYIMYNNNTLKAGQWAAFATDRKTKFVCSKSAEVTSVNSLIDCQNSLKVCEYYNVKFAPNNRGSYWATTNMSMAEVIREVIQQGVLLKT